MAEQGVDKALNFQWVANVTNREGPGVGIKIEPSATFVSAVSKKIQPYKNFPVTMKPALEKMADYVRVTMIPRTFQQEGPNWKPLAPRTVQERIAQGYSGSNPILVRSGDLLQELTQKTHPKHVEIIKTGKYARIEIGGSSDKFKENQKGVPSESIPSRPMIPGTGWLTLPAKDQIELKKILVTEIQKQIKKNG